MDKRGLGQSVKGANQYKVSQKRPGATYSKGSEYDEMASATRSGPALSSHGQYDREPRLPEEEDVLSEQKQDDYNRDQYRATPTDVAYQGGQDIKGSGGQGYASEFGADRSARPTSGAGKAVGTKEAPQRKGTPLPQDRRAMAEALRRKDIRGYNKQYQVERSGL